MTTAGGVATRIAAGTTIGACISPQDPPAQPSLQTTAPPLVAGAAAAVCVVSSCSRIHRRSHPCRPLHHHWSQEPRQGSGGALGNSLDVPASRFDAQIIVNGDRRRCSQCCRRRTRPRSRPHFAGQGAQSQTSGHGRQAALSCFSVRGRCCRQSGWGLAELRPPCAD